MNIILNINYIRQYSQVDIEKQNELLFPGCIFNEHCSYQNINYAKCLNAYYIETNVHSIHFVCILINHLIYSIRYSLMGNYHTMINLNVQK